MPRFRVKYQGGREDIIDAESYSGAVAKAHELVRSGQRRGNSRIPDFTVTSGPGTNDPRYRRGRFYRVTYKSGNSRTLFAFSEADARKEAMKANFTRPDDTVTNVENRGARP